MENPSSPTPPPAHAQPPAWQPDEPQGPGLLQNVRDAKAAYAFLATAAIIYLLCWNETGRQFLAYIPEATATKYGAYSWKAVRDDGQWWRVLTTLFVSRMGLDAVIYLVIFAQLGPRIEQLLGTPRFCVLYLGAGAGGVALAEILDPSTRLGVGGDTIVAVYAAIGAIPGIVLGMTGSLLQTVKNPEARGAVFYAGFYTLIRYAITKQLEPSILGALALGVAFGAGLTLMKRRTGPGLLASAVPLLVVAALIGLVASRKRWLDGKLVDRGGPATGRLPPPQQQPDPEPPETGAQPKASFLDAPETSSEQVRELRERTKPFLDRFGPLPKREDYTTLEQEEARRLLAEVERVATGTNLVMGELDPERVKLNLMVFNWNAAARIAGEYFHLKRDTYARALAGLTALYASSYERAEDHFEAVTRDEAFLVEVPEALYYYAQALEERHGLEVAASHYERYLRLVADGPHPAWRGPLVATARRKLGR